MIADCSAVYTNLDLTISTTGNLDVSLLTTQVVGGQTINFCFDCYNEDTINGL